MPTLRFTQTSVTLELPLNERFVEALKVRVPANFRSYSAFDQTWVIYEPMVGEAVRLVNLYFSNITHHNRNVWEKDRQRRQREEDRMQEEEARRENPTDPYESDSIGKAEWENWQRAHGEEIRRDKNAFARDFFKNRPGYSWRVFDAKADQDEPGDPIDPDTSTQFFVDEPPSHVTKMHYSYLFKSAKQRSEERARIRQEQLAHEAEEQRAREAARRRAEDHEARRRQEEQRRQAEKRNRETADRARAERERASRQRAEYEQQQRAEDEFDPTKSASGQQAGEDFLEFLARKAQNRRVFDDFFRTYAWSFGSNQPPPNRPSNPPTQPKDPYDVLQITRSATRQQIETAYRSLARKYHPDVTKDDGRAMQEINVAFDKIKKERQNQW